MSAEASWSLLMRADVHGARSLQESAMHNIQQYIDLFLDNGKKVPTFTLQQGYGRNYDTPNRILKLTPQTNET
jgi:hypothetical protein